MNCTVVIILPLPYDLHCKLVLDEWAPIPLETLEDYEKFIDNVDELNVGVDNSMDRLKDTLPFQRNQTANDDKIPHQDRIAAMMVATELQIAHI